VNCSGAETTFIGISVPVLPASASWFFIKTDTQRLVTFRLRRRLLRSSLGPGFPSMAVAGACGVFLPRIKRAIVLLFDHALPVGSSPVRLRPAVAFAPPAARNDDAAPAISECRR